MLVLDRHNRSLKLVDILKVAKKDPEHWHFVNIKILNGSKNKMDAVVTKMVQEYNEYDGAIFKVNDYKILIVARFGTIENHGKFSRGIEKKINKFGCRGTTEKMTHSLLEKIEVDFVMREGRVDDSLFTSRANRMKNVFMVVDDDSFILDTFEVMLENFGDVKKYEKADDILDKYVSKNPDLLILDIHLPESNGIELLEKVKETDPDACVLMLSGKSFKTKILESVSLGAVGFLTKPIDQKRLKYYIESCSTITQAAVT